MLSSVLLYQPFSIDIVLFFSLDHTGWWAVLNSTTVQCGGCISQISVVKTGISLDNLGGK